MKLFATNRRIKNATGSFVNDESGAVAAYVVILLAVLVGFVGLAVDVGRLYTTHSQAQAAADAAALAAATQLDGKADAIERATIAAMTTPLVNNNQDFAQGDATVQIVRLRFLHSLPAHDDLPITDAHVTTNPAEAAYVEATTETLTQLNAFLAAVGAGSSDTLAAAVAGNTTKTCKVPPLMICNPWEGSDDDVEALNTTLRGVTLLAKTVEGGVASWLPGGMALLDPPPSCKSEVDGICQEWDYSSINGTKNVALALARVPDDYCYPELPLSVRTGQANAMRGAINIRFDIYENPYFGGNKYLMDSEFRPARNVTKGWITDWVDKQILDADGNPTGTFNTVCESTPVDDPDIAFGLPPDSCFAPADDPLNFFNPVPCSNPNVPVDARDRIGDGDWNILKYWQVNHDPSADALPSGMDKACADNPDDDTEEVCVSDGMLRYDMYKYELWSDIPDNKSGTGLTGKTDGENGNPICYTGGLSDDPDRRKLSVAVINCQTADEGGPITGNSTPSMEAEFFVDMFLLRPIRGNSDYNIWLEFIEFKEGGDEAVHDIVQLYR